MAFVRSPSGEIVEIPDADLASASIVGYTPASPEDVAAAQAEAARKAEFSTLGQQALGAGEALLRGASFNLTDPLEVALGADPERIAGRREALGGLGTALEIGGAALPVLASGGTGALGSAARLAPTAALSRGTAALGERAATALLGDAASAAAAGVGRSIARGAVRGGITELVEGLPYAAGQAVTEATLGDLDLLSEEALLSVGLGTLLGGAAGAGLGAAGAGFGRLFGKLASSGETPRTEPTALREKVADWLEETEAVRNIKAAGGIQSDYSRAVKQKGAERVHDLALEMRDMGLMTPLSTPEKVAARATDLMDSAGEAMGAILRQADEVATPAQLPDMKAATSEARKEILSEYVNDPTRRETAKKLSALFDDYDATFPDKISFGDMHAARRSVDKLVYGLRSTLDPWATEMRSSLRDFREIITKELESKIDAAGLSSRDWNTAERRYEVGAFADKLAEKGVARGVGNNPIPLTTILSGIGGAAAGGVGGAAVAAGTGYLTREYGSALVGSLAREVRDRLVGSVRPGMSMPTITPSMMHATDVLVHAADASRREVQRGADAFVSGAKSAARAASTIAAVSLSDDVIDSLSRDPESLMEATAAVTADFDQHAPSVVVGVASGFARAVQYLASIRPKPSVGPFGTPIPASGAAMAEYESTKAVVEHPLDAYVLASEGRLMPRHVAALEQVWPRMLSQLRVATLDALVSVRTEGKTPSFRVLQQASVIFGQDLTQTVASGPANQRTMNEKPQQAQASPARADKVTQAQRSQTPWASEGN